MVVGLREGEEERESEEEKEEREGLLSCGGEEW